MLTEQAQYRLMSVFRARCRFIQRPLATPITSNTSKCLEALALYMVHESTGTDVFDFEGPYSLARAKSVLEGLDYENVDSVKIEISGVYGPNSESRDDTPDAGEVTDQYNSASASSDLESRDTTGESESGETEYKNIQRNSSHHRALYILSQLSNGTPVSSRKVFEEMEDDTPRGTVFAAMSELYQRNLVRRETRETDGQAFNVYELSVYGHDELDRLGIPDW